MGWDDLSQVVRSTVFPVLGITSLYVPFDAPAFTVERSIAFGEEIPVDVEGEIVDVRDTRPELHFDERDLAVLGREPSTSDLVEFREVRYEVSEPMPDGEGGIALKLLEAEDQTPPIHPNV